MMVDKKISNVAIMIMHCICSPKIDYVNSTGSTIQVVMLNEWLVKLDLN